MRSYFEDSVKLYEQVHSNQNGYIVKNKPKYIDEIKCDVQPSNREQIYNIYGYYVDCQFVVFFDNDDAPECEISEKTLIKLNNHFYSISKIIKWRKLTELYITPYNVR